MTVALAGLAGVIVAALGTFLTSRRSASSSDLALVLAESRASRLESKTDAAESKAEVAELRAEVAELAKAWRRCQQTERQLRRQLVEAGVIP